MPAITLPPLRIGIVHLTLVGDTILVVNKFSEKAQKEIEDKQGGHAASGRKSGRAPKVPTEHFLNGLHVMPGSQALLHEEGEVAWAEGRFGFPSIGIKAAAVRAATTCGLKMTDMRQAFHIDGELSEILCKSEAVPGSGKYGPIMRSDYVRLPSSGTADIAHRAEFTAWEIPVSVKYNEDVITYEQIANLFTRAGFGVGLGCYRPEKDGAWGLFHVGSEIKVLPYAAG